MRTLPAARSAGVVIVSLLAACAPHGPTAPSPRAVVSVVYPEPRAFRPSSGAQILVRSLVGPVEEVRPSYFVLRVQDATSADGRPAVALTDLVVAVWAGDPARVAVVRRDHAGRDRAIAFGVPALAFLVSLTLGLVAW